MRYGQQARGGRRDHVVDVVLAHDAVELQRLDDRHGQASRDGRDEVHPLAGEPRREHRQRRDRALRESGLDRVAVHELAVAVDVGTADVERAVHLGRHVGGADQVVQHVAHRDRLDEAPHPARGGHVGQHLGEVADHLERRRPRADDHPGLQHDRGHARGEQDLPHLRARTQVSREPRPLGMQAAEVDDAAHAVVVRRRGDVPRDRQLDRLEVVLPAHRVHEVVDDLDAVHRPVDRGTVAQVALDDVDGCRPRHVAQPLGPSHQHAHVVPGLDEARHEPASDVAGRTGHEHAHEHPRPGPRGWSGPFVPSTIVAARACQQVLRL